MALVTDSCAVDLALCVITALTAIYLFYKSKFKYWADRGVPFPEPCPIFGNFKENFFGRKSVQEIHSQIYEQFKNERFAGFYEMHTPHLLLIEPALINRVMVKDFSHFHDRAGRAPDAKYDPLTNNISFTKGRVWRRLRYRIAPLFSTGKIRGMFEQVYNATDELMADLEVKCKTGEEFLMKDSFAIFATGVIASCAFGMQFDPKSPEYETFKGKIRLAFPHSNFTVLISVLQSMSRKLASILGFTTITKEANEYFINFVREMVEFRKKNGAKRNDFLQLMMELKNSDKMFEDLPENEADENFVKNQKIPFDADVYPQSDGDEGKQGITIEDIAASSFLFLFAGLETVSTTMSNVIYDLATNPEIQTRTQAEVDIVIGRHRGYSYEAVKELQYMDQVIQESMRVHSIGVIDRECTVPYRIPGTDIILERGTKVQFPIISLHSDPRHYPQPELFRPERFEGNNYKTSPTYIPWGDGPRMCPAVRFSLIEMKVCLARALSEYTFDLGKSTPRPLRHDPRAYFPAIDCGIWVTVRPRK